LAASLDVSVVARAAIATRELCFGNLAVRNSRLLGLKATRDDILKVKRTIELSKLLVIGFQMELHKLV